MNPLANALLLATALLLVPLVGTDAAATPPTDHHDPIEFTCPPIQWSNGIPIPQPQCIYIHPF